MAQTMLFRASQILSEGIKHSKEQEDLTEVNIKKQVWRESLVGSSRLKTGTRISQVQEKWIKTPRVNNKYHNGTKPYRSQGLSKNLDMKIEASVPVTITGDDNFKSSIWNK